MLRYIVQIGVIYGNPEVTSGGNALKFYASVRLEVRRKATQEGPKGESVGIRVKAKVCILLFNDRPLLCLQLHIWHPKWWSFAKHL